MRLDDDFRGPAKIRFNAGAPGGLVMAAQKTDVVASRRLFASLSHWSFTPAALAYQAPDDAISVDPFYFEVTNGSPGLHRFYVLAAADAFVVPPRVTLLAADVQLP